MSKRVNKIPEWFEEMNSNPNESIPSCFKSLHLNPKDSEDFWLDCENVQKIERSVSALSFDELTCTSVLSTSEKGNDVSSKTKFPRHGRRAVSCQLQKYKKRNHITESLAPISYVDSHIRSTVSGNKYSECNCDPKINISSNKHELYYSNDFENKMYKSSEELCNSQSSFKVKNKKGEENIEANSSEWCEDNLQESASKSSGSKENVVKNCLEKSLCTNNFIIPELPVGHHLQIKILNNWGDLHYVGLNGIDIFSSFGTPVKIEKIWTNLQDVRASEYCYNPKSVENLISGINRTQDDLHLWLAPFSFGKEHYIEIMFEEKVQIAMIRVWNYNRSRIHSYRGVKDIELILDGRKIFVGEIARASGSLLGGMESFGDIILFTTDENILELTSKNDSAFLLMNDESFNVSERQLEERPLTTHTEVSQDAAGLDNFPGTANLERIQSTLNQIQGKELKIYLLENWGYNGLIGLNGIEILSTNGRNLSLDPMSVKCSKSNDVFKLLDGINCTDDKSHIWCVPYIKSEEISIEIYLPSDVPAEGIRIWNYNESLDMVHCGVKLCSIYLDGKSVTPPNEHLILRRAPGHCHYEFSQEFFFLEKATSPEVTAVSSEASNQIGFSGKIEDESSNEIVPSQVDDSFQDKSKNLIDTNICDKLNEISSEEYEPPSMLKGFVYQIVLLSTWGDFYYVGLTGIELLDEFGRKIDLSEKNVTAYPNSVNILDGISEDVRTPDKLIDGCNDMHDGKHMWLAPILPNIVNKIFIIFDYPVSVSRILIWNYGKMPSRGAKEFAILVDDLLVYNGQISKASIEITPNLPHKVVYFVNGESHETKGRLMPEKLLGNSPMISKRNSIDLQQKLSFQDNLNQPDLDKRPFTSLLS